MSINPIKNSAALPNDFNPTSTPPELWQQVGDILKKGYAQKLSPRYVADQIFVLAKNNAEAVRDNPSLNNYRNIKNMVKLYFEVEDKKQGATLQENKPQTKIYDCIRPLDKMMWLDDKGNKTTIESDLNPLYHEYLCVEDGAGNLECGGQTMSFPTLFVPVQGKPTHDVFKMEYCFEATEFTNDECMAECVSNKITQPKRPLYSVIGLGTNCQEFVEDVLTECEGLCGKK